MKKFFLGGGGVPPSPPPLTLLKMPLSQLQNLSNIWVKTVAKCIIYCQAQSQLQLSWTEVALFSR